MKKLHTDIFQSRALFIKYGLKEDTAKSYYKFRFKHYYKDGNSEMMHEEIPVITIVNGKDINYSCDLINYMPCWSIGDLMINVLPKSIYIDDDEYHLDIFTNNNGEYVVTYGDAYQTVRTELIDSLYWMVQWLCEMSDDGKIKSLKCRKSNIITNEC